MKPNESSAPIDWRSVAAGLEAAIARGGSDLGPAQAVLARLYEHASNPDAAHVLALTVEQAKRVAVALLNLQAAVTAAEQFIARRKSGVS